LHVFELFSTEPLNVVTDSAYVVNIVQRIADAIAIEIRKLCTCIFYNAYIVTYYSTKTNN